MNPAVRFQRPDILACPLCKSDDFSWPDTGPATCRSCDTSFPLQAGWPLFLREDLLTAATAEWNAVADGYSAFEPSCGFPLIDAPLIESCQGDVLEVGCGNGRLMRLVKDRCRTLLGIDPAPAMTDAARRAGFVALTAAAEDLPFKEGCFDQVISGWASIRYTDQDRSFPEVARVLRPGGSFTFTLWNYQLAMVVMKIGCWRQGRAAPAGTLDHFQDRDVSSINRLLKKLSAVGFTVEQLRTTLFPSRLARMLQPWIRYYRGRLGTRLGYNVIFSCKRTAG